MTGLLAAVVLLNYAAQVPYYLILYFPRPPSLLGVGLLAITGAWFCLGLIRSRHGRRFGDGVLGAFLATEVAFYGALIVLSIATHGRGGASAQLTTPDARLWVIFAVGYLNAFVAAVTLARLVFRRSRSLRARRRPAGG